MYVATLNGKTVQTRGFDLDDLNAFSIYLCAICIYANLSYFFAKGIVTSHGR